MCLSLVRTERHLVSIEDGKIAPGRGKMLTGIFSGTFECYGTVTASMSKEKSLKVKT